MADSLLNLMNESSSRFSFTNYHGMRMGLEIESFREAPEARAVGLPARTDKKSNAGGGMHITWEDLWVKVSNGRKGMKPILHGLTGYARPGELVAIMGPSGCGKSTLLDALAGRLSTNARKTGEILVNGHKMALAYGTSAYVMQDDALLTTLTVKEAVHYSAQLQLPASMSKAEKRERVEATIKEMGLTEAVNTRIGGSSGGDRGGLSGGQKRRVSICLEMLTHPKLLFLDEPTSGLDSAASYYVMNRIARLKSGDGVGRTIVASIHQPSSEVFQLFDSLCLLSSGKTVYFGPTSAANKFFASNGFPCPTLQNPSDHFLKIINKDFDMDIEQDLGAVPASEAINTLTKSYRSSAYYQDVLRHVAEICRQGADNDLGAIRKRRDRVSFSTQCSVLIRRSSLNMYRDKGYYWLRMAIYVLLAMGLGTIFYDIGSTYASIQARGSLLAFIACFLTFMAIGGFPSFLEDMKVFKRERSNGHYGTSSFVISNTLSSMPFLLLISIIPGAISYYLPGLHGGLYRFLYLATVLFTCMMLVESLMMIIASLVPTYLMGIIAGAGVQSLMILGGGFFRLPNDLPRPFWKYPLYYIAFHSYALQGLFKNEFLGLRFQSQAGGAVTTMIDGEVVLREIWQVDTSCSKWVDLGILLGMVVVYRVMFLGIIKTNEVVRPKLGAFFARAPQIATQISTEALEGEEL